MSIKDFHLVFIFCSILTSVGFGSWAIHNNGQPPTFGLMVTAGVSFLAALALAIYAYFFIQKLKIKHL